MQLSPERLLARLQDQALDRSYCLFGDEPQQIIECADQIRTSARREGIEERLVFHIEAGFDWSELRTASQSMSLFASRRLIEIRLGAKKPDKKATEVLSDLLGPGDADDVYLVVCEKLDRAAQKTRWFKLLSDQGVVVSARKLEGQQLSRWIIERARRYRKELSHDAAAIIATRVEGNLLAAAQEIEKLSLLIEGREIGADVVLNTVTDSARYDVFKLVDTIMAGDALRTTRMLRGLKEEGTEPVVIAWAINRELRSLALIAADLARGQPLAKAMAKHKVWNSRAALVRKTCERNDSKAIDSMLVFSGYIDRVIKGAAAGDAWEDLERLALTLAGLPEFNAAALKLA